MNIRLTRKYSDFRDHNVFTIFSDTALEMYIGSLARRGIGMVEEEKEEKWKKMKKNPK